MSSHNKSPCVVIFSPSNFSFAMQWTRAILSSYSRIRFVPKGVNNEPPSCQLPSGQYIDGEKLLLRLIARLHAEDCGGFLYGSNAIQSTEIDFFQEFSSSSLLANNKEFECGLNTLNHRLHMRTYIVGYCITIADITVWSALHFASRWPSLRSSYCHVQRWFEHMSLCPSLVPLLATTSITCQTDNNIKSVVKKKTHKTGTPSLIEFGDEWQGKVVTRFPPEPSGYLHVGHAKAAILNYDTAKRYGGRMILRFDDTNPSKEKSEYVDAIVSDLHTLRVSYDAPISYSSDYFDALLKMATQLVGEGKAYVDKTIQEEMRKQRFDGMESIYRSQSVDDNMKLWTEMQRGTPEGLLCVLRAKIDMQCANKAMRDPVIYRCNLTPHHKTGARYNVYPTYDLACPLIDSIEGVTHAMRTTEYRDRNVQYQWFCNALRIRVPIIYDFSRLNLIYTVMSKRKLAWLVDNKRVSGWDDPRFPTVRGLVRRGLTIEALTEFVVAQGASQAVNFMNWDKLWNFNKKVIDPIAHRYQAVSKEKSVRLELSNAPTDPECISVRLLPKNSDAGTKDITIAKHVWVEQDDALLLSLGEKITLCNWSNVVITAIERSDENVVAMKGFLSPDGVFSKTKKLNWVAAAQSDESDLLSMTLVELDHLITTPKMEGEFETVLADNSWFETQAIGQTALRNVNQGDIIQLLRRGFFICEAIASDVTPAVFIYIPDGHIANASTLSRKVAYKHE